MTNDPAETSINTPPSSGGLPAHTSSILSQLPPTGPAELKAMEASWAERQHYSAVGRVAANWSFLEALIDTQAISLAGVNADVGVCFTAQIAGSARKIDAYISLARLRGISSALLKELERFASNIKSPSERRNRTVHDVWIFDDPDNPKRFEATAAKVLRLKLIPVSTEKLLELAMEIEGCANQFEELSSRARVELQTSSSGRRDDEAT